MSFKANQPAIEPVARADGLAIQLDDYFSQIFAAQSGSYALASDPFLAIGLQKGQLGQGGRVFAGRVQFAIPYLNWYRVATADRGVLTCYAGEPLSSPSPVGPRSVGTYPAYTEVLVYQGEGPRENYGLILCALPPLVTNGNLGVSDVVVQGSNTGIHREDSYRSYLLDLEDQGGAQDFSNHRPLDQTTLDWGICTETGIALHVDPALAYLRVDEICGIFLHQADQLLTLAGYNYDFLSSVAAEEHRDDESELSYYRGESMYPWEKLGVLDASVTGTRVNSDSDFLYDKPEGKLEPLFVDQAAFCRYEEWGGYLGQGRIRSVSIPPQQLDSTSSIWRRDDERAAIGVFREQISADGEYALASAKGVTLAKRSLLASPKRKRATNDYRESSDNAAADNYRFSGQFGGAEEHVLTEPANEGDFQERLATAASLDQQAYLFNWKSLHVFHYHTGDFVLPEEAQAGELESLQAAPDYSALAGNMWIPAPEPVEYVVDHRQRAKYYALLSMLHLADDGSVLLQGGFGEEIKFDHGNILLSCPGNILLQSGKSTVVLAGDDAILRANDSVDITANRRDVRVKAQNNLHMLSGNGGSGGMLFETRSVGNEQNYPAGGGEQIDSRGIVFKAPYSAVSALAQEIYLSTGVAGPDGQVRGGPITLDAHKGNQNIRLRAMNLFSFLGGRRLDAFTSGNEVVATHYASRGGAFVNGQLGVTGPLRCGGFAIFGGNVQTYNGHFGSPSGGPVGRVIDQALLQSEVAEVGSFLSGEVNNATAEFELNLRDKYYQSQQVGNADTQIAMSFGLRDEYQYGTVDFHLPASYWQNMAEATSQGTTWQENEVVYQRSDAQMPWPGRRKWRDEDTYLTLPADSYHQYDIVAGVSKPRDDPGYQQPRRGPFVPKKPQDSYRIILS